MSVKVATFIALTINGQQRLIHPSQVRHTRYDPDHSFGYIELTSGEMLGVELSKDDYGHLAERLWGDLGPFSAVANMDKVCQFTAMSGRAMCFPWREIAKVGFFPSRGVIEITLNDGRVVETRGDQASYDKLSAEFSRANGGKPPGDTVVDTSEEDDEDDYEPTSLDRYRSESDRLAAYGCALGGLAAVSESTDRHLDKAQHQCIVRAIQAIVAVVQNIVDNDTGPPVPDHDEE